jgi:hypothetical protein
MNHSHQRLANRFGGGFWGAQIRSSARKASLSTQMAHAYSYSASGDKATKATLSTK